ncbi:ATP-binding SpoIIE family protein phosphatase [Protofrankia symbiont of Coriaria ruscifolia]|uniref:ATP-binding SpoIIE family protein phosphatase n=1 Tax=Protofrankia symbiont of Coriaria ruscifolia TaxID=1306542 RepID=UPI001A941963|nr:SpoIIE family protein phosphatase [Protofrankia symbiont of Coriaria ruscifolia]
MAPIGLLVMDAEMRVLWINQAISAMNGLSATDLGGRAISDLLPEVEPHAWEVVRQVLATGKPILDVELTGRTPATGPDHHVWRVSHYPIQDHAGTVVAVGVSVVDVTDQRRAEAKRDAVEQRLRLLGRASGLVGASLKLADTVEAIADLVVPEFADNCDVFLAEEPLNADARPERLTLRGFVSAKRLPFPSPRSDEVETIGVPMEVDRDNPAHQALATRRPVLFHMDNRVKRSVHVRDPYTFSAKARLEQMAIDMAIVVPLLVGRQFFGVAYFGIAPPRPRYTEQDVQTAEELGSRISNAVANAYAYERQRSAAVTLQRGLLPHHTPIVEGLDIAWRYEPGTAGTEVGGDWFDVIGLSAGRAALVIGDVMGRGLAAAVVMGRVRTAVRAFAALDLPAAEVLTHLDGLVQTLGTGPEETLVSCIYALYEPATSTICLANAGHLAPALVRPDDGVVFLDGESDIILGVGGQTFTETRYPLPRGSILALFTDGLVESPSIDIDEGCRRLQRVLRTPGLSDRPGSPGQPACLKGLEKTADRLLGLIDRSEGYDDDVALLLVRATDTAMTAAVTLAPEPQAARTAREVAMAALNSWGIADAAFTVELLVSEIVTNAIRYAETSSDLVLRRGRHAVYVEVSDRDSRVPRLLHPTSDDEGGRGLQLVAQLATRWGARPTLTGKTVWFQLDIAT